MTVKTKEMPESSKGIPGPFLKLKQHRHMARRTLPILTVRANINRRSVCTTVYHVEEEKGKKV